MKSRCCLFLLCYGSLFLFVYGQDDAWSPYKHVTGYVMLEANYYRNLQFFQRDYAIAMSEAGLLIEYRPLKKMTFKGVFVYRPNWRLRDMVSEASAEWTFSSYLKVKGGHLLTPLSPINTSFYAPVNLGVTMPMIVSHHDYYPTNMEALSLRGSIGQKFKMSYCAFGGGYYASFLLRHGPMNFFGFETSYFRAIKTNTTPLVFSGALNTDNLYYGAGAYFRFSHDEYFMIGLNIWNASEIFSVRQVLVDATKRSYGINFRFKYHSAKLEGEVWKGTASDRNSIDIDSREGVFIELSNGFGKITPYVKYEFKYTYQNQYMVGRSPISFEYERYMVGANYTPIYETTVKLAYFTYQNFSPSGVLLAIVYAF